MGVYDGTCTCMDAARKHMCVGDMELLLSFYLLLHTLTRKVYITQQTTREFAQKNTQQYT